MKMNTTEQRNIETSGRKTINNARIMLLCAGMIITMLVLCAGTVAAAATSGSVTETATVTATEAVTGVSIGSAEGSVGDTVDVSINITNALMIGAMDISVTYNASILTATNVANGSMMASLPDLYWAHNISAGMINISLATYPGMINGTGELFVVTFDIVDGDTGDSSTLAINAEAWTGEVPPQPVTVAVENGSVIVTPPAPPAVTVTTDASTYAPGDTMIVTLDITNPTSDPVAFEWYIGVPLQNIWITYAKASVPAGFDNSYTIPIPVGNWGPTPFDFVHYVRMLDPGSGEVLVYDVAWCTYSPNEGEAMPVDIADEIIKTAERVEFSI